jgi:phytoene dehydrogenase-like protein
VTERGAYNAVVVGAGPNGLAAAVELARGPLDGRAGDQRDTIGGGARSAETTLPGFVYGLASAIHLLGCASALRCGLGDDAAFPRLLWLRLPQDRTIHSKLGESEVEDV